MLLYPWSEGRGKSGVHKPQQFPSLPCHSLLDSLEIQNDDRCLQRIKILEKNPGFFTHPVHSRDIEGLLIKDG